METYEKLREDGGITVSTHVYHIRGVWNCGSGPYRIATNLIAPPPSLVPSAQAILCIVMKSLCIKPFIIHKLQHAEADTTHPDDVV